MVDAVTIPVKTLGACGIVALATAACAPMRMSAQAGYTQTAVSGQIALESDGGGSSSSKQDIESAFGLGDAQGSPWLRAQAHFGVPVLTASGFWLKESGTGVLDASFGGLPVATPVATDLELGCGKFSLVFGIDAGPVKLSPGLAIDVFDIDFRATETTLGNREEIDELLAVPMLLLRAEAPLEALNFVAEIGYLETPEVDGNDGSFLDVEAMIECVVLGQCSVIAGYRLLDLDAKGETDSDSFVTDLQIRGWFVGGGIRF
ncbi:MAG TPA: hypothetical protein VF384_17380 [Planctomycetota bacterium]